MTAIGVTNLAPGMKKSQENKKGVCLPIIVVNNDCHALVPGDLTLSTSASSLIDAAFLGVANDEEIDIKHQQYQYEVISTEMEEEDQQQSLTSPFLEEFEGEEEAVLMMGEHHQQDEDGFYSSGLMFDNQLGVGVGGGDEMVNDWISHTLDLDALGPNAFAPHPAIDPFATAVGVPSISLPSSETSTPMTSRLGSPAFSEDDDEFTLTPMTKMTTKKRKATTFPADVDGPIQNQKLKQQKKKQLEEEIQASQLLPELPKKKRKVGVVMTAEEKRERNKHSAQKYRLKQRFDASGNEERMEVLERENQLLQYSILKEKQQLDELRRLLITHGILLN